MLQLASWSSSAQALTLSHSTPAVDSTFASDAMAQQSRLPQSSCGAGTTVDLTQDWSGAISTPKAARVMHVRALTLIISMHRLHRSIEWTVCSRCAASSDLATGPPAADIQLAEA